jgi:hypothetical protein
MAMGFMDFMNQMEGSSYHGSESGGLKLKQPIVLFLLGSFAEQEIQILQEFFDHHIHTRGKVFWICSRENALEDGWTISCPSHPTYGHEVRKQFAEYGNSEELIDQLTQYAGAIFNKTSESVFVEHGSLTINFLVKPDEADSGLLLPLLSRAVECFSDYFNVYIQKDIYLLADQQAYNGAMAIDRMASNYQTMRESSDLVASGSAHMAYFLSNVDDKGRFRINNVRERYASVALLIMAKSAVAENQQYLYQDADFGHSIDNTCFMTGLDSGKICSAGYMRLETEMQLSFLIACKSVWKFLQESREEYSYERYGTELEINPESLDEFAQGGLRHLQFYEEDWQSIVRNRKLNEDSIFTMYNGEAIEKFYGRNVDLYLELNYLTTEQDSERTNAWIKELEQRIYAASQRDNLTPKEILLLLKALEGELKERIEQASSLSRGHKDQLDKWKSSKYRQQVAGKGKNKDNSQELMMLVKTYLTDLWKMENAGVKQRLYSSMLQAVERLLVRYQCYTDLVDRAMEDLDLEISSMIEKGVENAEKKLQVIHADAYYESRTMELLNHNSKSQELRLQLLQMVNRGEISQQNPEKLYQPVFQFCQKEILVQEDYQKEFLEEVFDRLMNFEEPGRAELRRKTDIANYVLQGIEKCRHYLCRDTFEGQNSYREMCFFLDDVNTFTQGDDANAIAADLIRKSELKLFCEKNNHILDVLFLAGNIRVETIYQYDIYKRAYIRKEGGNLECR